MADERRRRAMAMAKAKLKLQQDQSVKILPESPGEAGMALLRGVGRTADAVAAPVRSATSKAIDAVQNLGDRPFFPEGGAGEALGKLGGSLKETFVDPLRGTVEAPTSGDIRKQLGVEDKDLSIPLPGNVPLIGDSLELAPTVDAITGTAMDPAALGGVKPAVKELAKSSGMFKGLSNVADKVPLPGGELAIATGKQLKRSAHKAADAATKKAGAERFSKLAQDENLIGNAQEIYEKSLSLNKRLGASRAKPLDMGTKAGARVDIDAVFSRRSDLIERIRKSNPSLAKTLEKKMKDLREVHKKGMLTLEEATDLKGDFRDALPDSAYNIVPGGGRELKPKAASFVKEIADDLQHQVVKQANSKVAGLGDEINAINKKFQTNLAAQPALLKAAAAEEKKALVSGTDVTLGLLSGAASSDPVTAAGVVGAKKLFDASKTPGFRTKTGQVFEKLGKNPVVETVLRRATADANQE